MRDLHLKIITLPEVYLAQIQQVKTITGSKSHYGDHDMAVVTLPNGEMIHLFGPRSLDKWESVNAVIIAAIKAARSMPS